jgi:ketopantoate reductase
VTAPLHVAVIGAGALGRVYGVHLHNAGARVSFVVHPERLDDQRPFVIERLNGDRAVRECNAPILCAEIPRTADVILLAVRGEQIDAALEARLRSAVNVPVIALTPILPHGQQRLRDRLGDRLVVAMPTIAAQPGPDGVVRYWAFDSNPTSIEKSDTWRVVLSRLIGRFAASHLAVRLERDVWRKNPATTIAFFPWSLAIGAAGSLEALGTRDDLLAAATAACKESLALARRVGPIEPSAALGAQLSGPRSVRAVLAVGRRMAPRAVAFLDAHFGAKLDAQHAAFGAEILELGREHGIAMPRLEQLLSRVPPT